MSHTDVAETTEQDTAGGMPQDVVRAYFEAGNRSDVDGVLALFAEDAVVMAEGWETAIGRPEIRSVYERTLAPSRVRRDLRVEVDDIVEGDDVAAVRTHSSGTVSRLEYGASVDVFYRELFVLRRSAGRWLVAAYMFNSPTAER
jgi:uncharacterized protein (TIGR02246 family)